MLRWAGTPGGDGEALNLHVLAGAFFDIALNKNEKVSNVAFIEIPDIIPPKIISCRLNLTDGQIVITLDEHVQTSPVTIVDITKLFFANVSASNKSVDRTLPLLGAGVIEENDVLSVTMTLPESSRIASIRRSGTEGGDGSTLFLDADSGAFLDISSNPQEENRSLIILEVADTKNPTVEACYIDYNDGRVTITLSEHINAAGFTGVSSFARDGVFLSKIRIANSTNVSRVEFAGEELVMSEGYNVTVTLNEYKRVQALRVSGKPGETIHL